MTAKNTKAVKYFAIGADSVVAMNVGLGLVSVLLPELHIWLTFPLSFFYELFTEAASQRLLYNGAKKSKMTKKGEAFTLASISYLAILVKYILAKKKKTQIKGSCLKKSDKKLLISTHQDQLQWRGRSELTIIAKIKNERVVLGSGGFDQFRLL